MTLWTITSIEAGLELGVPFPEAPPRGFGRAGPVGYGMMEGGFIRGQGLLGQCPSSMNEDYPGFHPPPPRGRGEALNEGYYMPGYGGPSGGREDGRRTIMEHIPSNITKKIKPCVFCHMEGSQFRCGSCKMYYCSASCQQKDWGRHKDVCQYTVNAVNGKPLDEPVQTEEKEKQNGNKNYTKPQKMNVRGKENDQPARSKTDTKGGGLKGMEKRKEDKPDSVPRNPVPTRINKSEQAVTKTGSPGRLNQPKGELKTRNKALPDEKGDGTAETKYVPPTLATITLSEGNQGLCSLTYYESPSKCWITLQETFEDFTVMMGDLATLDDRPAAQPSQLKAGDLICIKYNEEWSRAHIMSKSGDSARVVFVDHGNQEVTSLVGARKLHTELLNITPAQALCCCVSKVRPKGASDWNAAAIEAARQWFGAPLTGWFSYFVTARRGSTLAMDFSKVEGDATESLAEFLVSQGHAEKVDFEALLPNLPTLSVASSKSPPKQRIMARELKTMLPDLQADQVLECDVLENPTPRSFAMCLASESSSQQLRGLERLLKLEDDTEDKDFKPVVGELVVAIHPGRGSWQRAEVLTVDDEAASLHFVDLGHTDFQLLQRIRPAQAVSGGEVTALPAMAVKCGLAGTDLPARVDELAVQQKFATLLQEYRQNGVLTAVVVSKSANELMLDFVSDSKPTPLSVALRKELLVLAKGYLSDSSKTPTPPRPSRIRSPVPQGSKSVRNLTAAMNQGSSNVATSLSTLEFPDSQEHHATVRFITDCTEFYVTLNALEKDYRTMEADLNAWATTLTPMAQPVMGSVGVTRFTLDNKLYRCRIDNMKGQEARVTYVDFGNSEIVPLDSLFSLPATLASLPAQAIKCRLKGDVDNLDPLKTKDFRSVENQPLLARKVGVRGGSTVVQLFEPDGGIDLSKLMGIEVTPTASPGPTTPSTRQLSSGQLSPSPRGSGPKPHSNHAALLAKVAAKPSLPKTNLPKGQCIKVECILTVDPSEFFVQKTSDADQYVNATLALTNRLKAGATSVGQVSKGDVVAARYSEDTEELWYRVQVEEMLGSHKCRLFFMDFGFFEESNVSGLKKLEEEDFKLPPSLIKCCLSGYAKGHHTDLSAQFAESAQAKIDSIKVKEQDGETFVVDIYDHTGSIITQQFVKEPSKPKPTAPPVKRLEMATLPDEEVVVTVTYIESASDLYVNRSDGNWPERLIRLMLDLNERAPKLPQLERPCVGTTCAAQSSQDNTWYRVVIESMVDAHTCLLYFLDYGSSEKGPVSGLKSLDDPSFFELPAQAIHCCLQEHEAGLKPGAANTMTDTELDHLKRELLECQVVAKVVDRRAGTCVLALKTEHGEPIARVQSAEAQAPTNVIPLRDDLIDELPPEKTFQAIVHHCVNAVEFYCMRRQECSQIAILSSELLEDMEKSAVSPDTAVVNGVYCCNFMGQWYRCVVEKIVGSTVTIRYIDFGNSEERPVGDLKLLNTERLAVPVYAFRCKLSGLCLKPDADDAAIAQFWAPIVSNLVTISIVGEERDCMLVSASLGEGQDLLDLASVLLELDLVGKSSDLSANKEEEDDNIDEELQRLKRQIELLEKKKRSK